MLLTVSVIIPTHNRYVLLRRVLEGLCAQTYPLSLIEAIVVADGCSDGTVELIRGFKVSFALRVIEQPRHGAASARNNGAAASGGQLLVFLDDDVVPSPHLIEAHVRAQGQTNSEVVGIGYSPLILKGRGDFFKFGMRAWWGAQYTAIGQPGHRYSYRSVFSGNLAVQTDVFKRMGGFDATLPRREDYEFGVRLLKGNVSLLFVPDAIGYHHDNSDLSGSLRRANEEGRGDVRIGFSHPELRRAIQLAQLAEASAFFYRVVVVLAFAYPKTGNTLAFLLRQTLTAIERVRIRNLWRRIYIGLRAYWYLRGAAEELGSRTALGFFLKARAKHNDANVSEIDIDLKEGIETAERQLDRERPHAIRILYGRQLLGRIPAEVGAERLSGRHLRQILAKSVSLPLITTLIVENAAANGKGSRGSVMTMIDDVCQRNNRNYAN
jgi:glycosyltransferase involved in cell wall biosynthesis